jgi:hypothetical protein
MRVCFHSYDLAVLLPLWGVQRVRGLDGLRVVDASIMPNVPSANNNTYASTLMIGEKAADMMGGRRRRVPGQLAAPRPALALELATGQHPPRPA